MVSRRLPVPPIIAQLAEQLRERYHGEARRRELHARRYQFRDDATVVRHEHGLPAPREPDVLGEPPLQHHDPNHAHVRIVTAPGNAGPHAAPIPARPTTIPPVTALTIDTLQPADWPAVAAILAEGIATGSATFETAVPPWEDWDAAHLPAPRLVARDADGSALAWAALVPVSRRTCYAGVAELSIYVAARARGRGTGRALLEALVRAAEAAGFWTLQAVVFPENAASVALHERCGFRLVGRRERIAQLGGRWQDTLLYERRA